MKEEIYNFYVNNLSSKKLVFRYMERRWIGFIIVSIITFCYLFRYAMSDKKIAAVIALIPFAIYFMLINYWAKKILKSTYNIESKGFMWGNSSYDKMRKNLLIRYLKSKNIHTEKKLKELINMFYKEGEKKKYKGFINWGILVVILVPLWAQFISTVFKFSANTLDDAIQIFLSMLEIITIAFIMLSILMDMVNDNLNDIINKESNRFNILVNMLEAILFEIDVEHSNIIL